MKKISIGLTLMLMTKEQYFKIIDDYHENIDYIYYSPCRSEFFSRAVNGKKIDVSIFEKDELEVLKYARAKGIKLELALNTKVKDEVLLEALINEEKRIHPDAIVTTSNKIETARKVFPDVEYILSYNEAIFSIEQIRKLKKGFDCIVVGNRWIRNINYMKEIKELGYKVKLMLNNGCSHNCTYCYSGTSCRDVLFFNIAKHTFDVTAAINTIFPFEVHEYYEQMDFIDNYKISNRPCKYEELNNLLMCYTENINDFKNKEEEYKFMCYMTRIGHYGEFLHFADLDNIKRIKHNEWEINLNRSKINEHNDK